MRLSSNDLYLLIRSFSAKEKMLFKRFNKQAGAEAAYIILFDVLASLKTYDEQALQKKLKQKKVDGYLKSLKTYLYDQIMLFLRTQSSAKNKRWKLRQLNADADLLFERGLKQNALQLHKEQLELACTISNPSYELTALDNLILYASRMVDIPMLQKYELEFTDKLLSFHNLLLAQNEFRKIEAFYAENYPIRNREALIELNTIGKAKIMEQETNIILPLAHMFYFNFHIYFELLKNNYERAFEFAQRRYTYETNQGLEGMHIHKLNSYELMIKTAQKSGRIEIALQLYNALTAYVATATDIRFALVRYSCFSFLNAVVDWEQATIAMRTEALEFFIANKTSTTVSAGMMSLAYAFFRHGQYNNTLTLLNMIMDDNYSFRESVLQTEARLLAIITHYELKNYLLISYLVTNTRRYLKQEEKLYPLENALLNGIKHLPEKINEGDMQKALLKLKTNLQQIAKNPLERNAMSDFDFADWIKKKLEK